MLYTKKDEHKRDTTSYISWLLFVPKQQAYNRPQKDSSRNVSALTVAD